MVWPASVLTRTISFGKAVVLETGDDLSLRAVTRASRSLISLAEGFRMQSLVATFTAASAGDQITFQLPVTNQPGWLDADTREPIAVGATQHTHLYTTVLTIFRGESSVAEYTIGPYPMPQGASVIDGDTMLVPSTTQEGVLVPLPQLWQEIIDSANAATTGAGSTAGQVWTSNGPNTPPSFKAATGGGGGTGDGNMRVVFYNATTKVWPARPVTADPVQWWSTTDPAALRPVGTTGMRTGDSWLRHPAATVAP